VRWGGHGAGGTGSLTFFLLSIVCRSNGPVPYISKNAARSCRVPAFLYRSAIPSTCKISSAQKVKRPPLDWIAPCIFSKEKSVEGVSTYDNTRGKQRRQSRTNAYRAHVGTVEPRRNPVRLFLRASSLEHAPACACTLCAHGRRYGLERPPAIPTPRTQRRTCWYLQKTNAFTKVRKMGLRCCQGRGCGGSGLTRFANDHHPQVGGLRPRRGDADEEPA
jgi:hypothetical protein